MKPPFYCGRSNHGSLIPARYGSRRAHISPHRQPAGDEIYPQGFRFTHQMPHLPFRTRLRMYTNNITVHPRTNTRSGPESRASWIRREMAKPRVCTVCTTGLVLLVPACAVIMFAPTRLPTHPHPNTTIPPTQQSMQSRELIPTGRGPLGWSAVPQHCRTRARRY